VPLVTVLWDHVRQCAGGRRRRLPAAPSRELPATPGAVRDLFSLVAQDRPTRFEYRLTRELWSVMMTLMQWGDRYYGAPDRQHCQAPEAPTGPKSSQNDLFVARGNVNAPSSGRPGGRAGMKVPRLNWILRNSASLGIEDVVASSRVLAPSAEQAPLPREPSPCAFPPPR
jgi:hypothetical protein